MRWLTVFSIDHHIYYYSHSHSTPSIPSIQTTSYSLFLDESDYKPAGQVDYEQLILALIEVLRVHSSSDDEGVAINALHTIVPVMTTSEDYAVMLLSEPELLSRLLVESQGQMVRKATQETLFKLCEQLPSKTAQVLLDSTNLTL